MAMFDDLKEAIYNLIQQASQHRGVWSSAIDNEIVDTLQKVADTYFIEPEDDEEFKQWQSSKDT